MLSNVFRVVYRDMDKIIRELGVGDRIVSVDLPIEDKHFESKCSLLYGD